MTRIRSARCLPAVATLLSALVSGGFLSGQSALPPEPGPRVLTFSATDTFDVTIPKGARHVRCWFETPQDDPTQRILDITVECPFPYSFHHDDETGNRFLHVEIRDPAVESFRLVQRFTVSRREIRTRIPADAASALSDAHRAIFARFLRPEGHVVINEAVERLAREVTAGAEGPVAQSRRIYASIIDRVEYWKKDATRFRPSGVGSTEYCMKEGTGNCTDFHALFLSLTRARGIPSRFLMGVSLPAADDGADRDAGYHCWAEFFAPGLGWIPVDASAGDVADDLRDYYFGNLDERRVTLSSGRELNLAPRQSGPRVNFFVRMHCEVDGAPHTSWSRRLTWRSLPPSRS